MSQRLDNLDPEAFEELEYDAWRSNRERRQARQRLDKQAPPDTQTVSELAEPLDLEAGFEPTYHAARHEKGWLLESLRPFYEDSLITDVLSLAQGGKEANVYCCRAHLATGRELLAAKVYRPRKFRNLRNDKLYREGREILTEGGRPVNARDQRIMRAIGKKTDFGVQVEHTSWLMHEYVALRDLSAAGADVPVPLAAHDNALLMEYVGDAARAAPTLHSVRPGTDEAPALLRRILHNVELMLTRQMVHGDLSAYNILYWEGAIALIDFPQAVNSIANPYARELLYRDVTRICEYFGRCGLTTDPNIIAANLWRRHGIEALSPEEQLGDLYVGPLGDQQ